MTLISTMGEGLHLTHIVINAQIAKNKLFLAIQGNLTPTKEDIDPIADYLYTRPLGDPTLQRIIATVARGWTPPTKRELCAIVAETTSERNRAMLMLQTLEFMRGIETCGNKLLCGQLC